MQNFFILILSIFILSHDVSFSAETPMPTEQQSHSRSKTPDFSPPDLNGPVFPIEDVIGEPNPDTNRFLSEFISMVATLGLIISLILIVAWFLKRMVNTRQEQANETSIIKLIERRSLSPKTAIYLLEIEGKSLVIAESPSGVTRLSEYNTPEEKEAEPHKIPSAFNKILEKNS
jgi:flagellar protein FliO/FliZ